MLSKDEQTLLEKVSLQVPSYNEIGYDQFGLNVKVPQYKQQELQEDSVFSRNIRSNKITVGKIAPGAITEKAIANGSITEVKISNNAITAPKIGANEVITQAANIANGIITNAKIANLDAGKITSGSIPVARTDAKCTNASADQTSANPQSADWLSTNIEKAKLGTTIIESGYLKTNLLNTANAYITNTAMISNGIITNAKIANATITAAKIHDLNADKITAGTITGITIQTAALGLRTLLNADNVKFYDGATLKGLLKPDGSKSMLLGTASSFFVGDLSGNYNTEITGGGSIHISKSGQNIRFANDVQITDYTDAGINALDISGTFCPDSDDSYALGYPGRMWHNVITNHLDTAGDAYIGGDINVDGKISNSGNIQCGGKFESSDGSGGVTNTSFDLITHLDMNNIVEYYHTFDFKDGLVTNISGEHSRDAT